MKQIEAREFKERSLDYLTGNEPLVIEHEGEVVGFYYPKKRTLQEENDRLFAQLDQILERMAEQNGMTKDELIDALDPSKPFPFSYEASD
jgi:tetrahydromethanopterin S-methyltransferase subunit B